MEIHPEPQQWQQGDQFDEGYLPASKDGARPAPPAQAGPQGFAGRVKTLACTLVQRLR